MVTKFVCIQSPSYSDSLFLLPKCEKKSWSISMHAWNCTSEGNKILLLPKVPTFSRHVFWQLGKIYNLMIEGYPQHGNSVSIWHGRNPKNFIGTRKSLCADWSRLPKSLSCRERAIKQSIFFTAPAVVFFYGIIIKNSNMIDFCYLHLTPYDDHYFVSSSALGHMIFFMGRAWNEENSFKKAH